jgi:hypothetical protein
MLSNQAEMENTTPTGSDQSLNQDATQPDDKGHQDQATKDMENMTGHIDASEVPDDEKLSSVNFLRLGF